MGLVYGLVLMAIAWVLSVFVNGINDVWSFFSHPPLWLTVIVVGSAITWLVSDP